jgi:hypothetical protein
VTAVDSQPGRAGESDPASESAPGSSAPPDDVSRRRWRGVAAVAVCALLVAGLTALVVLARAGGDIGGPNWPIDWDMRNSDNTVLFQFAQEVVGHRPLDWSFSPQVYVFPEIPISLFAYAVAAGSLPGYLLVVAAVNNALLFLALLAVISRVFAHESLASHLRRAGLATAPLVLLPLLRGNWLFEYHLAPTYYFGMYLAIVAAPLMFLARRRGMRVTVAAGLALTAASNPLTLVFVVPAAVCAAAVAWRAGGWAQVRPHIGLGAGVVAVAAAVRLTAFRHLQGDSPLSYVDVDAFTARMRAVVSYVRSIWRDPVDRGPVLIGAALAVAGVGVAIAAARAHVRRRWPGDRALLAVYAGLVPAAGLAATVALLITNYLYLWPVLVAPLVFALVPVPRRFVPGLLASALAALVLVAVRTHAFDTVRHTDRYLAYRAPETRCLDEQLPDGVTVGYATLSDSRRLALTSRRPFRLIAVKSSGQPASWLTNRATIRTEAGRFFYINDGGDEPPISRAYLTAAFGPPDRTMSCAADDTVWIYDDPAKLAAIATHYATEAVTS